MRPILILIACTIALATPAAAQTVEELQAQLEAQIRINELLKQRIRTLEAEAEQASTTTTQQVAVAEEPAPVRTRDDPEETRALERALVREGIAVLPPGAYEVSTGLSWSHSGSESDNTARDSYNASLDARMGLAGGWMIGAGFPVSQRDTPTGSNSGLGDASLTVWKEFMVQEGSWPTIVGSLRYTNPTGEDFTEDPVPLGGGVHRLQARLSATRSIDPIAFYGGVSYSHSFEETFGADDIQPGGVIGANAGASLAVTPEISLSAGVDLSFVNETKTNGVEIPNSSATVGTLQFGAGVLVTKDLFLSFFGGVGITEDAPDFTLGFSMPFRF